MYHIYIIDGGLKFKVTLRGCPVHCSGENSVCIGDNVCSCQPGYMGANCQTKLECVSTHDTMVWIYICVFVHMSFISFTTAEVA